MQFTKHRILRSLLLPLQPLVYLLEAVYPSSCLVCSRPTLGTRSLFFKRSLSLETFICSECQSELIAPYQMFCRICGRKLKDPSTLTVCENCTFERQYITSVVPLNVYKALTRSVILFMKNDKTGMMAKVMAGLYYQNRLEQLKSFHPDCVIAVPMNWRRKMKRSGINAPEIMARELAKELKLPCYCDYVRRSRSTVKQTVIDWNDRFLNVYDAFEVRNKLRYRIAVLVREIIDNTWLIFPGLRKRFRPFDIVVEKSLKAIIHKPSNVFVDKNVIIVDDAFTSGATTNEVARKLMLAGAQSVMVACVARAGSMKNSVLHRKVKELEDLESLDD